MLPVTLRTSHFWLLDPFDISPISVISISKRIQTTASYHIVHEGDRGSQEGRKRLDVSKSVAGCQVPGQSPNARSNWRLDTRSSRSSKPLNVFIFFHMFSYVFMLQADAKSLKILGLGGLLAQNFKDLEKWYEASVPTSSCMSMHVDVCWCVQKKHTKFGAHKRLGVRSAGMHLSCLKLKAKMFF